MRQINLPSHLPSHLIAISSHNLPSHSYLSNLLRKTQIPFNMMVSCETDNDHEMVSCETDKEVVDHLTIYHVMYHHLPSCRWWFGFLGWGELSLSHYPWTCQKNTGGWWDGGWEMVDWEMRWEIRLEMVDDQMVRWDIDEINETMVILLCFIWW